MLTPGAGPVEQILYTSYVRVVDGRSIRVRVEIPEAEITYQAKVYQRDRERFPDDFPSPLVYPEKALLAKLTFEDVTDA